MRAIQTLRILSKTLRFLLLGVIVSLAVLLGGIRLFGLTPYTVLSGSMEPTYHVGSVIYVSSVDPMELKVGDPITYPLSSGTVVTHRIEAIVNEDSSARAFRTKGDANDTSDGAPVLASSVIGKPLFSIPYLGYVSEVLQKPIGLASVIGVSVAVLILSLVADTLLAKGEKPTAEADTSTEETL